MWGLIIAGCIAVVAVALHVADMIGAAGLAALLTFALASGALVAYFGQSEEVGVGPLSLKGLRQRANEITAEALDKINKRVAVHEEALSSVIKKADDTRRDLLKVAEEAAPPLLSFVSEEIRTTQEGYMLMIVLKPSKNAPFGTLTLTAEIVGDSEATIIDLSPGVTASFSGTERSPDGKRVTHQYSPAASPVHKPRLSVSAPCKARISCSHMREPLEVEIK